MEGHFFFKYCKVVYSTWVETEVSPLHDMNWNQGLVTVLV